MSNARKLFELVHLNIIIEIDTDCKDVVVLVVERGHRRFGQLGALVSHDWREFGTLEVRFADGGVEEFYDGLVRGDAPSSVGRYYRREDLAGVRHDERNAGPDALWRNLEALHVDLAQAALQYRTLFNAEPPWQAQTAPGQLPLF